MTGASGALFGLAIGDALGARTEFLSVEEIRRRWPPDGPTELEGDPARVTDDTQMALAVGEALIEHRRAGGQWTAPDLEGPLRRAFVEWLDSPENDRAPGNTCLTACDRLKRGLPWAEATVAGSKGCGANMRVAPVGLLNDVSGDIRAAIAQFQAALTHGHPTALAASDLTAYAVADLATGGDPTELLGRLRVYAESQRTVYHEDWLGDLWKRPTTESPDEFIARGWDECLHVIDRVEGGLRLSTPPVDACQVGGAGWTAEEAIGTALYCFLLSPEDGVAAVRRGAMTSGDSDSIACLAGSLAGAHLGLDAWPAEWVERIEYRERLSAIGEALSA